MITKEYMIPSFDGVCLYTKVFLPSEDKKFPVIVRRSPYVDTDVDFTEDFPQISDDFEYALVFQHCRGRGRSEGDCIPYINEKEDGLCLLEFIRNCPFYNGEIYLYGGSYECAMMMLVASEPAADIKGAIFNVMDSNRYNMSFRNGVFKYAFYSKWYSSMYKAKTLKKDFSEQKPYKLPFSEFSERVFGEKDKYFDELISHPCPNDIFWETDPPSVDTKRGFENAPFPILIVSSWYDIFLGGIVKMWNGLSEEKRNKCAMFVGAYEHSMKYRNYEGIPFKFKNGSFEDVCENYICEWFDFIRKNKKPSFFEAGCAKCHLLFDDSISSFERIENAKAEKTFYFGSGKLSEDEAFCGSDTYLYDPQKPARFNGGGCTAPGGMQKQSEEKQQDVLTFISESFSKDMTVLGNMTAKMTVSSDCPDTCFYARVSIVREDGAYVLRDDITTLQYVKKDYKPNEKLVLDFDFDMHYFKIKAGEKLRLDISSSCFPQFLPHTNKAGNYWEQKDTVCANNTIFYGKESFLKIHYET